MRRRRTNRRISIGVVGVTAVVTISLATSWNSPPRFDGAGYAVLARSISEGRGYRAIDHPDEPRHAHFPPGYPFALAAVRAIAGDDVRAFHLFSVICAVGATLAAHRWFRALFGSRDGTVMALALATNWAWIRAGGGIQSEPLYELLAQFAILIAMRVRRIRDSRSALGLGILLGAAFLTRHIAIALIAAVFLDLALSRRWRNLVLASITMASIVVPWVAWVSIRAEGSTQAELLSSNGAGLITRIGGQILFYVQRIPDHLTGPFVEVATVFQRSAIVQIIANVWAISATSVIVIGWIRFLARPRARLAGLIPLVSLGVLLLWPFTEAGRFLIPLIPCLILGALEGLTWMFGRLIPSFSPSRLRRVASTLLLAASLPYAGYDLAKGPARTQESANRDFDAACAWIARQDRALHPGPVLTRHPGEVFLQTGRQALDVSTSERAGARDATPEEVAEAIARYKVAYLLVDDRRYANAPPSPLGRFVESYPERVRKVWGQGPEGIVSVYEVLDLK